MLLNFLGTVETFLSYFFNSYENHMNYFWKKWITSLTFHSKYKESHFVCNGFHIKTQFPDIRHPINNDGTLTRLINLDFLDLTTNGRKTYFILFFFRMFVSIKSHLGKTIQNQENKSTTKLTKTRFRKRSSI